MSYMDHCSCYRTLYSCLLTLCFEIVSVPEFKYPRAFTEAILIVQTARDPDEAIYHMSL